MRLRKSTKEQQKRKGGDKFTRKAIIDVKSPKHMLILAYEAERAWAHASELKANTSHAKQKHHARTRFAKAVKSAKALYEAATKHIDDGRQRAQCAAYLLMLEGELKGSASIRKAAQALLNELARTAPTAKEQVVMRELADSLDPLIRYGAWQAGIDDVASLSLDHGSVAEFDALLSDLKSREAVKAAEPLTFGEREIPLAAPELVEDFEKVRRALASLNADSSTSGKAKAKRAQRIGPKRMAKFDAALSALTEAEASSSRLRGELDGDAKGAASSKKEQQEAVTLAHEYMLCHLHTVRASRDLALISRLTSKLPVLSPNESDRDRKKASRILPGLVKLYDNVLVAFESTRELSLVDGDTELADGVEARIAGVKARRSVYLARAYAMLYKYAEAMTLLTRGSLYAREAASFHAPTSSSMLPALPLASKEEMDREYAGTKKMIEKSWYDSEHQLADLGDLSLATALGTETEHKKKKEEFYDVAHSYVTSWDLDAIQRKAGVPSAVSPQATTEEEEEEEKEEMQVDEPAAKKKGWFGFLRG